MHAGGDDDDGPSGDKHCGDRHHFDDDDGICIKANHAAIAGSLGMAVRSARERMGHLHKLAVEVASKNEISEAIESGTHTLVVNSSSAVEAKDLIDHARELSPGITVELSGPITLESIRTYAEAGADLIRVDALTQSVRAMDISFQIQPG